MNRPKINDQNSRMKWDLCLDDGNELILLLTPQKYREILVISTLERTWAPNS